MKIAIIGIGSLGSFLCKELCNIEFIKELTLIDFDRVLQKNIKNSIYTESDVGKYKTYALKNILSNYSNKDINFLTDSYNGNNINFSKYNYVIDCRDLILPYDPNISFKCFICGSFLIIDCKKENFGDKIYDGNYRFNFEVEKIKMASKIISCLIDFKKIDGMIEKKLIYKFELDILDKKISFENNICSNKINNLIHDDLPILKRCKNFEDIGNEIINYNDNSDIFIKYPDNNLKLLPKQSMTSLTNFANLLYPIIESPFSKKLFILNMSEEYNKRIIELIEMDGGA